MGNGAESYFRGTITKELLAITSDMDRQERGGRAQVTFTGSQFDEGGTINSFGDFATSGTTGFIHARVGERVLSAMTNAQHGPLLDAISSPSSYVRNMQKAPVMGPPAGSGHTFNISALDGASVDYWLRNGGAKKIQGALNQNVGSYAGTALS